MNVTFTLTGGSSGTSAGPFNISGTTSGGALNGVSIAAGVTKAQLLTGHTVNSVLDTITGGTIASTGTTCPSSTTTWFVITATSTPTPTPTVTPTPLPVLNLIVISSGGDGPIACTNNANSQYTFDVYSEFHQLVDGDTLYADALGDTMFVGTGGFYSDGSTFGKINSSGVYTQLDNCPS
jgi:hypothetical protein